MMQNIYRDSLLCQTAVHQAAALHAPDGQSLSLKQIHLTVLDGSILPK
ncbi:MAG: hypothetical protein ACLT76_06485 [Clostridium fessum]